MVDAHSLRSFASLAQTEDNHFPTLTTSERLTHLGGGMNLHAEVLAGTDEGLEVGDVLGGGESLFMFIF